MADTWEKMNDKEELEGRSEEVSGFLGAASQSPGDHGILDGARYRSINVIKSQMPQRAQFSSGKSDYLRCAILSISPWIICSTTLARF
jgi:hypothetical protein